MNAKHHFSRDTRHKDENNTGSPNKTSQNRPEYRIGNRNNQGYSVAQISLPGPVSNSCGGGSSQSTVPEGSPAIQVAGATVRVVVHLCHQRLQATLTMYL